MNGPTFVIPLWADLLAAGLSSVQGAMFASAFAGQRRLDLLGVSIIGIVMGMGGGLIRDLLLNVPPAGLHNDWYILVAGGASMLGMLVAAPLRRLNGLILGLDAVVIGLFGAFGTSKALGFQLPLVPAVFVGVCSAVGGGILRDIMMDRPVEIMHVGSLYAVAAGGGCLVLAGIHAFGVPIPVAAIIGIVVTAVIRLLAVMFNLSLPEQRAFPMRRGRREPPAAGDALAE